MTETVSRPPPEPRTWRFLLPWLAAWIGTALLFSLWPEIDLATSRVFWQAGTGFSGNQYPALTIVHRLVIDLSWWIFIIGILWLALASLHPGLRRFASRGAVVFILLTLAAGPGGLGKATKDTWGRARPHTVQEFGGNKMFTPVLVKTDQCERNCSFFSGHASFAFWIGALALAFGRRRLAWGLSLGFGTLIGLMRIAQGGHFLSDVLFAGLFVVTLNLVLFHFLRGPLGLERPTPKDH